MCGICGGIGPKAPNISLLEEQLKAIEHRGPDDHGTFLAPEISLAMCRLAIVEISSGRQPASDEHSRIHLVFNGEIYNYQLLRDELSSEGVQFQTSSEVEVIIRAFLQYGISFIDKLNGMFAIALFDSRSNELFLIRDRMGKKPLWISEYTDGSLLFASEVRALMIARSDRTLRTEMITEVMQYGFINAPNSAFNEISQVPPGSYLHWKKSGSQIIKYWTPTFHPKKKISYQDALEQTKSLIESAVKRRLISERPIGSFLSGGYDSTVVTAYMTKHSTEKVQTYSIGFDRENFNEAHHAKRISEYLGTNHHEEILSPDPSLVVETISRVLDLPFADSSIVPTYLLSKFARNDLVVALSGDGGDEIFGGYPRYDLAHKMRKFPQFHKLDTYKLTKRLTLKSDYLVKCLLPFESWKSNNLWKYFHQTMSEGDFKNVANEFQLTNTKFFGDELHDYFGLSFNRVASTLFKDLRTWLPMESNRKLDRISMWNSIEARSPFQAESLIGSGLELMNKSNFHYLNKYYLYESYPELQDLPISKVKTGFISPVGHWLRSNPKLQQEALAGINSFLPFNNEFLMKLQNAPKESNFRYTKMLWSVIVLYNWLINE